MSRDGGAIRVTVISPGVTESELSENFSTPGTREWMREFRKVAIGPDAIARAIAFVIEHLRAWPSVRSSRGLLQAFIN